jgi:hypothetical protein
MAYLKRQQTLYQPLPRGTPVKLRAGEGAELDEAASIYGLAPSTLARLLVNRGVKAILEERGR